MATESPVDGASASGISAEAYQSLRSQVHRLKTEHRHVLGARKTAQQLENLAQLQQHNEAQQQEEAYIAKIAKLQASLQEATVRSGKIRQQYERAQRVVQAESDRLAKQLEEERTCFSEGTDDLKQHHAQQLSALQLQLTKQQQMLTDQQQQWKEERHTTELQAAQWCEGQVQAVRKEAAEAAVAAEAIVDSRSLQCQELQDNLQETIKKSNAVESELRQTQSSNTELTRSIELLQEELKAAKSVSAQLQSLVAEQQQRWHDQSRSVQAEHEKQLEVYCDRKLQEMQAVHARFKEVLQKKEETHAITRAQLQGAHTKIRHFEALFEQQRSQLLQLTGSDN